MLGTTFSHETIRSYVVAFGTLFNSIQIWRKNSAGTKTQTIDVPLSYAPKEKWLARIEQDPSLTNDAGIVLPRMSYELVSMVYAADRKLNTMQKTTSAANSSDDKQSYAWSPVPYDFFFTLHVYARNNRDASMIVEQILPFFTPEFTVSIKELTELDINLDVPIILNTINKEETYEGSYEQIRSIVWTLDFTVKGVLYGPVRDSNIIKKAYIDMYIPTASETITGNAVPISGGTTTQIHLANTASLIDNFYVGGTLDIINGDGSGSRSVVQDYSGVDQVATLGTALSKVPAANTQYSLTYINPLYDTERIADGQLASNNTSVHANTGVMSRIYTQPGLTSDGLPTTNLALSVAVSEISSNSDYGIIQTITLFPNTA